MTIDPVQLAHGVTVTVNVPQMPQVCPAPEAPTPGGVTVPVQGSLTAEQLAHIVTTVTAKVVEELGGQPGGGGAGIDDTTIGTDTTWSSQKIVDDRAPGMWPVVDLSSGPEVIAEMPVTDGMNVLYFLATTSVVWETNSEMPVRPAPGVSLRTALPADPEPGKVYAIRASDGTITWHQPNLGG